MPAEYHAAMGRAIKHIHDLMVRLGGEEHAGWLPPGAAKPPPTPVRDVLVDLSIEFDESGYFLICAAQDESFCWDGWYQTLTEAEAAALRGYGVGPGDWIS